MLPNHSPLIIAEQFGTLESLYPNRIDLGLGRAPGTDQLKWRALRRDPRASDQFPQDVQELQGYFVPLKEGQNVQAVPGTNLNVPFGYMGLVYLAHNWRLNLVCLTPLLHTLHQQH